MPAPIIYNLKLTDAGKAAAIAADNLGLHLTLTEISFGTGQYDPIGTETALFNEVKRVPLTGVMRPQPNQLRLAGVWSEYDDAYPVGEFAVWSGAVLVGIWSRASGGPLGYKTVGVQFVLFTDLVFDEIPADSIQVVLNPLANEAIAALIAHENADDAHIQYLERADFVIGHSLMTADSVGGTPNALTITLPVETIVPAYSRGMQLVFIAIATNTGAVTAAVNGLGAISVTKSGAAALAPGDIQMGAVYTLFYDGTKFQISGGVGGGVTMTRFPYTATAGQTTFAATYLPGMIMVFINGRELPEADYDGTSGTNIILVAGAQVGDSVEIVVFKSFSIADVYTRAQADALFINRNDFLYAPHAGLVELWAFNPPPVGRLKMNGAAVSRASYPRLFAAIGTTFGVGDGSTTFNVPEVRGEWPRFWDDARGIDTGRQLGSAQAQQLMTHSHTATSAAAGAHLHSGTALSAGTHVHTATTANAGGHVHTMGSPGNHTHALNGTAATRANGGTGFSASTGAQQAGPVTDTLGAGDHIHAINTAGDHGHTTTIDAGGAHVHTISTDTAVDHTHAITVNATGGAENRVRNVAFLGTITF